MKKDFLSVGLMTLCAVIISSVASASTVDCTTVSNVTTLTGSNNCQVTGSNLLFSNFAVSPSAGLSAATIGIGNAAAGTTIVGEDTTLAFQIGGLTYTGATGFGDILMFYTVSPSLISVDLALQASPVVTNGSMTITEVVCSQAFTGTNCNGTTLANIAVTSTGNSVTNVSPDFVASGPVFIKKDIQFNGAISSEFTNSQLIPEPMTLTLMGAGLLGLGIFGRRRFGK